MVCDCIIDGVVNHWKNNNKQIQAYNPSVGLRRQLPLHRGAYMKQMQTNNPSVGLRWQLCQARLI